MKRTPLLTAICGTLLFFASCKNGDKPSVAIPKDAAIAMHINSKSLSSKLSWQEIKATNWFKELYSSVRDSVAQKVLDNPDASGVDTQADLAFFLKKQGKGGYGVFEGSVKNATDLQNFLTKVSHGSTIKKEGDWNFLTGDSRSMMVWNNSRFAFIMDMPGIGAKDGVTYASMEEVRFPADSLKKFVTGILNLDKENSLASDDRYTSLLKESGDMHLWLNSEQLYSGMVGGMMSMMKMNVFVEGSAAAATMSFDEGRMSMKWKQYYGKEMTEVMKKMAQKNVSADLFNRIPSENVIGAFAANYPPESMMQLIKIAGLDGVANAFLGRYNYSLDQILSAYNGQMVLAITDLSIKSEMQTVEGSTYQYPTQKPDMQVLFGLSVKDKAAFDRFVETAKQEIVKEGGEKALSMVTFKTSNDWFAVSNNAEKVDQFLAASHKSQPFADKISGHPFGMYVDIQKILKAVQPIVPEPTAQSAFEISMKLWEDVVITGGEFKDGCLVWDMNVNLIDKKTNSLKQMNQYIEQLASLKKTTRVDDVIIDTTTAAPAEPAH